MGGAQEADDNPTYIAPRDKPAQRKEGHFFQPFESWVHMPAKSSTQEQVIMPLKAAEKMNPPRHSEREKSPLHMSRTYIDDGGNLTKTTLNYNDSKWRPCFEREHGHRILSSPLSS